MPEIIHPHPGPPPSRGRETEVSVQPLHKGQVNTCICLLVYLAILSATAGTAWGWGDSWESIRRAAGGIAALEAEFVQEKHLPILVKPLISEGRLLFQAPDSLRWEYFSPVRNVLLMHKGRSARHVAADGQWTRDRSMDVSAMGVVTRQIAAWLGGNFEDSAVFKAALAPGPTIVMIPREASLARMIQRIELKLAEEPGLMESVTIFENETAFTRLTFQKAVLNPQVDPARFGNP